MGRFYTDVDAKRYRRTKHITKQYAEVKEKNDRDSVKGIVEQMSFQIQVTKRFIYHE